MKKLMALALLGAAANAATATSSAEIKAAPVPSASPEVIAAGHGDYRELRTRLQSLLKEDYERCNRPAAEQQPISIYPLNEETWLAQMPCWVSNVNGGDLFVLLDGRRQVKGRVPIEDGYEYSNGDGRGIIRAGGGSGAGCASEIQYVWDGQSFREGPAEGHCAEDAAQ